MGIQNENRGYISVARPDLNRLLSEGLLNLEEIRDIRIENASAENSQARAMTYLFFSDK